MLVGLQRSGSDGEFCADGIADHGGRDPCTHEQAVATHEATAMGKGEEGAPEFLGCAAVLAQAGASGQVKHLNADD